MPTASTKCDRSPRAAGSTKAGSRHRARLTTSSPTTRTLPRRRAGASFERTYRRTALVVCHAPADCCRTCAGRRHRRSPARSDARVSGSHQSGVGDGRAAGAAGGRSRDCIAAGGTAASKRISARPPGTSAVAPFCSPVRPDAHHMHQLTVQHRFILRIHPPRRIAEQVRQRNAKLRGARSSLPQNVSATGGNPHRSRSVLATDRGTAPCCVR